jgi:hypothetical protein
MKCVCVGLCYCFRTQKWAAMNRRFTAFVAARTYPALWCKFFIYKKLWAVLKNKSVLFRLKGTVSPDEIGLKVVWLGSPWWLHGSQMVLIFLNVVSIFNFIFQFRQQYIAKTIGAACNYPIPQANLHAGLSFVHAKNLSLWSNLLSYLKLLLVSRVL